MEREGIWLGNELCEGAADWDGMLLGDALLVGNLVLLGCNESFSDGVMLVLG